MSAGVDIIDELLGKKGPCKAQKFQNRVWALILRGKVQYILKSSFCYDLQIILKF